MSQLQITMLGPRGVGKSSLLACMYRTFGSVAAASDLKLLAANSRIAQLLDERYRLMLSHLHKVRGDDGLVATERAECYDFTLSPRRGTWKLDLSFHDFPGGWLDDQAAPEYKSVVECLQGSDAILLAIDTPSLMVSDSFGPAVVWHEERNRVASVLEMFRNIGDVLSEPKLVLLAPIKCERWVQTTHEREHLLDQVRRGYRELLSELGIHPTVTAVIMPIETLGNLHWRARRWLPGFEGRELQDVFRPSGCGADGRAAHLPRHIEQPLLYVLSFALRRLETELGCRHGELAEWLNGRNAGRKLLDKLFDIDRDRRSARAETASDRTSVMESLEKLNDSRVRDGQAGFHVLQGAHQLA